MAGRDEVVIISDSPSPPASPPSLPTFDLDDSDISIDRLPNLTLREPSPKPSMLRSGSNPDARDEGLLRCEEAVLSCFPDICLNYVKSEAVKHDWDPQRLIIHILDEQDKGEPYPKRPRPLKRKRQQEQEKSDEEEMRKKLEKEDARLAEKGSGYVRTYARAAKTLLKASFPHRYSEDVENLFKQNGYQVYTTYLALDKDSWSPEAGPIRVKKSISRRGNPVDILRTSRIEAEMDALAAFDAARTTCLAEAQARNAKEAGERQEEEEEEKNMAQAKAEGTIADCGCCYDEKPLNRMVHCNGETVHWFCRPCAKQMAEHVVGASKYHLACMSMDGCDATFSRAQRELFLDDNLTTALELIEQEAVLRMAGIENLATCPFCNYAAEYPPVEENKEFRCEKSDCGLVSCRLCRKETHVPKTCDEAARERGVSARRTIEEAMSAALIRKCNKCGTPFIKENGCNKMTCTRDGCRNVQCYVCSKSCDYAHFDDSTRGGKKGNCPLFDSVEERHQGEVHAAEEEARKKVAERNPGVDTAMLKINFSDRVKQDDERRKAANPGPRRPAGMRPPLVRGRHQLHMPAFNREPFMDEFAGFENQVQPVQQVRAQEGQHPHQAAALPAQAIHAAPAQQPDGPNPFFWGEPFYGAPAGVMPLPGLARLPGARGVQDQPDKQQQFGALRGGRAGEHQAGLNVVRQRQGVEQHGGAIAPGYAGLGLNARPVALHAKPLEQIGVARAVHGEAHAATMEWISSISKVNLGHRPRPGAMYWGAAAPDQAEEAAARFGGWAFAPAPVSQVALNQRFPPAYLGMPRPLDVPDLADEPGFQLPDPPREKKGA